MSDAAGLRNAAIEILRTVAHSPHDSFGFRLWHVVHAWQRRVESALAPLDLTHMQFVVLALTAWLSHQGETPTQSRIASFGKIDRMMLSKILRLLEDKGYIRRARHPDDPRANRVDLAPAGVAALGEAAPLLRTTQDAFFGRLTAAGQASLAEQLDLLMAFENCRPGDAPCVDPAQPTITEV